MSASRSAALSLWLLCATGCAASVDWKTDPTPERWRRLTLYRGEIASIAARNETAAVEVYQIYEDLVARWNAADLPPVGTPLLFAMRFDDPAIMELDEHAIAKAGQMPGGGPPSSGKFGKKLSDEERAELKRRITPLFRRMIVHDVPMDDSALDLPGSWRQGGAWSVAMPTHSSAVRVADDTFALALASQELSFGRRALLSVAMPFVRGMLHNGMLHKVKAQALDHMAAQLDPEDDALLARVEELKQQLGLELRETFERDNPFPGDGASMDSKESTSSTPGSNNPGAN